jgi:hypothetical protein
MLFSTLSILATIVAVLTNGVQLPKPSVEQVMEETRFVDVCPTLFNAKEVGYLHQQGHHEPLNVIAGCYAAQVVVTDDMPQYWRYPVGDIEFLVVGIEIGGKQQFAVIEATGDHVAEQIPQDDIPQADVESVVAEAPACATVVVQPCTDIDEGDYE